MSKLTHIVDETLRAAANLIGVYHGVFDMDNRCSVSRQLVHGSALAMVVLLAACGGDGGDGGYVGDSSQIDTLVKASVKTGDYTLGGTIDLQLVTAPPDAVTGLVLSDGTETYAPTLQTAGQTNKQISFNFPTALAQGTHYSVSVASSPQGMGCTASNNTGTIGAAPVSTVTITCTDSVFYVSGNVHLNFANPLPSNVELAISDGTDNIAVQLPAGATTGKLISFMFPTPLAAGASYHVTVPSNPTDLTCTPANASGTITANNVTDVSVTCSDSAFYLSGKATVSLRQPYTTNTATVLLTDGTDLAYPVNVSIGKGALTAGQSFIFPSLVAQGAAYTVSVTTDPPGNPIGLTCTPSNNHGTVGDANVTNIAVNCSDAAYPLGGTVTGLQIAGGVQLSDGIGKPLLIGVGATAFTFPTDLAYNSRYAVQIEGESLVQCTLANATGAVLGPVADALQCSLPEFALLAGNSPTRNNSLIGPAATFSGPTGVAVDRHGNVFVADTGDQEIRRITPAGVVTPVAGPSSGLGSASYPGSGPSAVAVDAADNLYVADPYNDRIVKITPAGHLTTFASPATLGCDVSNGSIPVDVAVDASGNVYTSCNGTSEILKITPAGNVTSLATLNCIFIDGFAVGPSNNVYVACGAPINGSVATNSIFKITPAGVVSNIASFTGGNLGLQYSAPVAVDGYGNVYVADSVYNVIHKITPSGVVTTLAGSGVAGSSDGTGSAASFDSPEGVAADAAGNVFVADTFNSEIRKITATRDVTTIAGYIYVGGAKDGVGNAASFNGPSGVAFDASGNVYVADTYNDEIRKIAPSGVVTTLIAHDGKGNAVSFVYPNAVAVDAKGNLFVASSDGVYKVTPTGLATMVPGSIGGTVGMAVDAHDNVYVSQIGGPSIGSGAFNYVFKITPAGVVTTLATSGEEYIGSDVLGGLAVDASGNVYVAGFNFNSISKISPSGVVTTLAGSGAAGSSDGTGSAASFNTPSGIALDPSGNLYVADTGNFEIRKVTPAGSVTTIVGNYNDRNFSPGSLPGSLGPAQSVALSPPDQFGDWNMVISTGENLIAEIVYASAAFY